MQKRICFVVQRYGIEIVGGAESLCRQYIAQLKDRYEINVATSCATDYNTWENVYPDGLCIVEGIEVYRFRTDHPRISEVLGPLTRKIYDNPYNSVEEGLGWLKEVGPYCPRMIEFIEDCKDFYDVFIFVGYHYYNTTFGMPMVPHKAIFIPTAHDEQPIKSCNYFRALFNMPAGIIYLTQQEKDFILAYFKNGHIPSVIAGIGLDMECVPKNNAGIAGDFIVYAGRIDETKNCDVLISYFKRYKQQRQSGLWLVLLGESKMQIPQNSDIAYMGFVAEKTKKDILAQALAFVMPSQNESLSITTLEAMAQKTPVIVNGGCKVLKEHVRISEAGLCYTDYEGFRDALDTVIGDKQTAERLGENGSRYVAGRFTWDHIIGQLESIIEAVVSNG